MRYFQEGRGQLWERQSLCKARVLTGSPPVVARVKQAITAATFCKPWQASQAAEIHAMRLKLQESASSQNLKRNAGGTMDTEFVVQLLQLKHGVQMPEVRVTNTLAGLVALEQAGVLATSDAEFLRGAYRFQRSIEARIRLMDSSGRHEFPEDPMNLAKLAYLLGYADADLLVAEVEQTFRDVRSTFLRVVESAERGG